MDCVININIKLININMKIDINIKNVKSVIGGSNFLVCGSSQLFSRLVLNTMCLPYYNNQPLQLLVGTSQKTSRHRLIRNISLEPAKL